MKENFVIAYNTKKKIKEGKREEEKRMRRREKNEKKNGLPDPEMSDSPVNPKTIPMKHCASFQIKIYVLTMNKFIMCDTIFIEFLSIQ